MTISVLRISHLEAHNTYLFLITDNYILLITHTHKYAGIVHRGQRTTFRSFYNLGLGNELSMVAGDFPG